MKIIKFKFASRKDVQKNNSKFGCKLFGIGYFIINDDGIIIAQIPQIIEGEYRRTDNEMLKTSGYWFKKNHNGFPIQDFRKKFLPESSPDNLTKNSPRKELSEKQIELINLEFLKHKQSFLTSLSLLTGSNISGCESNKLNQPFFYISDKEEDEWNFFNPINCFKKIRKINHKIQFNMSDPRNEFITFEEYFNLFPKVISASFAYCPREMFRESNRLRSEQNKSINKTSNLGRKIVDEKIKKGKIRKVNLRDYIQGTEETLTLYVHKKINYTDDVLKSMIRTRFTTSVNIALSNQELSYSSFQNDHASTYHNAHIISMKFLLKDKTNLQNLIDAASPYNCLRLSPNLHDSYDKHKISFNPEGEIVGKVKSIHRSEDIINSKKRRAFIKKNYQNWEKYKKNL